MSEEEEEVMVTHGRRQTFRQRLFERDSKRFNKYIKSTTTHGVVYVFVGKSKIRRLFWSLIVLTAAIGCLYNVANRVIFLAKHPTSTTVGVVQPQAVDFPAVTLCNLNLIKKSYLDGISTRLGEFVRKAFYAQGTDLECRRAMELFENHTLPWNQSFSELLWYGRHTADETILSCKFMGQECNSSDFLPNFTPSGICYTFNGGRGVPVLKANGMGTRFALTLIVNVLQNEYNAALYHDAGIKIAVHPQTVPPQPDELGIAVSPGKNAFISVRQTNIENRSSKRKCVDKNNTTFKDAFPYSVPACQLDCLRADIAQKCKCLSTSTIHSTTTQYHSQFSHLRNCTIRDVCCQVSEIFDATSCNCREACSKTLYTTSTSYSAFPANYAARDLADYAAAAMTRFNVTVNASVFHENILGVNVYFESLTVEERTTDDAYDAVALLSDIGGQLGLFLGASVISVFEFLTWLFDEAKDRCCGISERKIEHKFKSCVAKVAQGQKHKTIKKSGKGGKLRNNIGGQVENDYRKFESL